MAELSSGIYSMPPLILSQDISQSYWQWSDQMPWSPTLAPPTSPNETPSGNAPVPNFGTTTNELDKYRALFLIIGIVLGAMFLSQRR